MKKHMFDCLQSIGRRMADLKIEFKTVVTVTLPTLRKFCFEGIGFAERYGSL